MEVELRARVDNLEDVKKRLVKKGAKFNKQAEEQDDTYYVPRGKEEVARRGDPLIRVRKEGKKAKLNVKLLTSTAGIWDEHEVSVSDGDELKLILKKMGLVELFTLVKRRTKGRLKEFGLFLDDIEVLGSFLEIELLVPEEEAEAAQQRIRELMHELVISEEDIEAKGYARLLREEMGTKYA